MITKILWIVIGLNCTALAIATIVFLLSTSGRNVDSMESGWMTILFISGVVVLLLAAVPLRLSQSAFSLSFSGFFAFLPLAIGMYSLISNYMPSFKKQETMAEIYYRDDTQQGIAAAIEKGDTVLLKELIKGQDLNIQGNRVWDWDGLNYLQFAVRLRSNGDPNFDEKANDAAIRILIDKGSDTTPALAEAIKRLSPELVSLLLDAGADPNTSGFTNADPLLFEATGASKRECEIAKLLVKKGALVNSKNSDALTPVMFLANNAGTSDHWAECWPFVRFLLEDAHADYSYTRTDGLNLKSIITSIQSKALEEHVTMPADFQAVVKILENDSNYTKVN
jgi:hypothetical protein